MEVLDYYGPHDKATMAQFWTSGIARYLTNSMNDPRQLTVQEVRDAHELGLSVHCFFEMNPTFPAYFTYQQGAEDCRQAQARLRELGAPDGTVVYFTVDTNIEPSLTDEYFNGVESVVTPAITPGAYGYERFCEYAHEHFPNIGKHLWQTYGIPTVPLDGYQHRQEARAGVQVDVNDVSAPGWKQKEENDMTPDEVNALIDARMGDTITAIKAQLALDAHHTHLFTVPSNGGRTSEPLEPPVPGAAYFSSSDDLSMIGWTYPDGTTHFFQRGVEVHK